MDWKHIVAIGLGLLLGPPLAKAFARSHALRNVGWVLSMIGFLGAIVFMVLALFPGQHALFWLAFVCLMFGWGFLRRAKGRPYWY